MKLEDLKSRPGSKKAGSGSEGAPVPATAKRLPWATRARRRVQVPRKGKGFEGGQMPLSRRIPKRGFKNPFRKEYAIVKVGDLQALKGTAEVGLKELLETGLIDKVLDGVKLLSNGDIDFAIKIKVHKASQKAIDKIKAQGGEVEVIQ